MSFCSDVKSEICKHKLNRRCCRRAELAGLMLGVKIKKNGCATLKTSILSVAEYVCHLMHKNNIDCNVKGLKGDMYDVSSTNPIDFNKANQKFDKDCCKSAYVRGAFLACGQFSNPGRSYRVDFNFGSVDAADNLFDILKHVGFEPRVSIKSNGKATVYFKNSSQVEDLLTYMGAPLSTLGLMEIRVEKDYKNHINRAVNFETANYVRSFDVGEAQVAAIKKIQSADLYNSLPDELKIVAEARLENSDASLSTLAEIIGVSKSSINRRLKKLLDISENIKG